MQQSVTEFTTVSPRVWSYFQKAIFDDVALGEGHTVVMARAGCGKTTTIIEALRYVPAGLRTLLVAFNKPVAVELQERVIKTDTKGVTVSTLHSYGLRTITARLGRKEIDEGKNFLLVQEIVRGRSSEDAHLRRLVCKIASMAKGALVRTPAGVSDLIDQQAISLEKPRDDDDQLEFGAEVRGSDGSAIEEYDRALVCKHVLGLMRLAFERADTKKVDLPCANVIDFDDMIWLPVVMELQGALFDRVFVDELQDLNAAQIELVLGACRFPGGRICGVGDDKQAIYGFRGADKDAMPSFIARLKAKVLPLSVTYRCAKSIVRHVQPLVPDFEAGESNPEGIVRSSGQEEMRRGVRPGDFILSRTNAPLVALVLDLLRERRPAVIQGSDLGTKIRSLVERSGAHTTEDLLSYIAKWHLTQVTRLEATGKPTQPIEDLALCVHALASDVESVSDLFRRLDGIFNEADNDLSRIVLSSTHKAKGLERDRVWLLSWTYQSKREGRPVAVHEEQEGKNLYYVACTRAKSELILVQETGGAA